MMPASRPLAPPAHKLSALLAGLAAVEVRVDRSILGLSLDSRKTRPGDLFLACASQGRLSVAGGRIPGATKGVHQHGADFIEQALKAGAAAVAWDSSSIRADDMGAQRTRRGSVPLFGIENLHQQLGAIAARFYDHPAKDMLVTGVTGTNGKTTVANLLAGVLHDAPAHAPCGVIGTLGYGLYGKTKPGARTTPDALTLQGLLAEFRAQRVQSVVMEASSHGLEQGRVNAVPFHTAIFTNLSRDHLDYHGDMAAYGAAKRRLFFMPGLRCAVINGDDEYGRTLLKGLPAGLSTLSYGLQAAPQGLPHVRGNITRMDQHGLALEVSTPWGEGKLESTLLGKFNASNLLAVLAALLLTDMPLEEALTRLSRAKTVPGRMERFGGAAHQPTLVVDYAHTPDALSQALTDLRTHLGGEAKLWCVFGCGGERDRGKRPLMGAVAEQYADYLVVTDDNPRGEDPVSIIADILSGMTNPDGAYIQRDRAQAIALAAQHAAQNDVVLIAGKGHEEYQIMGARKIPFSDRREVRRLLNGHTVPKEQA